MTRPAPITRARLRKAPALPSTLGHEWETPEGRVAVGAGLWVAGLARLHGARVAKLRGDRKRAVRLSRLGIELVAEGVALVRRA